ncbi:uncharacterized protein LOC132389620 isoform X2 [Hypanus sabinus]|uniref:uncharacterized protein LOC132389620 isoform X2 n=1 Tax=Hypanus sabinus TaxID=79690 RepID=UPI0028C3F306|nr:uncharacterized protein LOC132389620 isoform X2 [Hypanus sabinus]
MLPVYLLIASLVTGADLTESPCLLSDVLCTTADYQLRRYKESVWVGTHVDVSISPKVDTSMQRLLSYTRGGNSAELWIQSNGQFLISFTGDGEITMYLLVPEELWENPPTPTSPQAFITRFPTMDVLSRRIRWNAMTQANDFNRTLTEQNAKFNNSFFFVSFCKGRSRCKTSPRPRRYNKRQFGQYSPLAGTAVFQLEGADEHTTTAPSVPTRLDRSGGRVTTASPRASRPGSKRRCNTSPPARRCKGRLFSFLGPFEGLRKRSIRTSAGALTSGERSFWGAEVSIGGNEVWFVATGEMDCPLM